MLLPTATKTKLVNLVRAKGYDVPSIRQVRFEKLVKGKSRRYCLSWLDSESILHFAFYSACAGRPYLEVNHEWTWLSMAEVIQFELVEEKKGP